MVHVFPSFSAMHAPAIKRGQMEMRSGFVYGEMKGAMSDMVPCRGRYLISDGGSSHSLVVLIEGGDFLDTWGMAHVPQARC